MFDYTFPYRPGGQTSTQQAVADRWTDTIFRTIHTHGFDCTVEHVYTSSEPTAHVVVRMRDGNSARALAALLAGNGPVGERCNTRPDRFGDRIHVLAIVSSPVDITWLATGTLTHGGTRPVRLDSGPSAVTPNHTTIKKAS